MVVWSLKCRTVFIFSLDQSLNWYTVYCANIAFYQFPIRGQKPLNVKRGDKPLSSFLSTCMFVFWFAVAKEMHSLAKFRLFIFQSSTYSNTLFTFGRHAALNASKYNTGLLLKEFIYTLKYTRNSGGSTIWHVLGTTWKGGEGVWCSNSVSKTILLHKLERKYRIPCKRCESKSL